MGIRTFNNLGFYNNEINKTWWPEQKETKGYLGIIKEKIKNAKDKEDMIENLMQPLPLTDELKRNITSAFVVMVDEEVIKEILKDKDKIRAYTKMLNIKERELRNFLQRFKSVPEWIAKAYNNEPESKIPRAKKIKDSKECEIQKLRLWAIINYQKGKMRHFKIKKSTIFSEKIEPLEYDRIIFEDNKSYIDISYYTICKLCKDYKMLQKWFKYLFMNQYPRDYEKKLLEFMKKTNPLWISISSFYNNNLNEEKNKILKENGLFLSIKHFCNASRNFDHIKEKELAFEKLKDFKRKSKPDKLIKKSIEEPSKEIKETCPYCGTEVEENDKSCEKCGHPLLADLSTD